MEKQAFAAWIIAFQTNRARHLTFIVRNIPWTPMSHVSYVRPCMYVRSNVRVCACVLFCKAHELDQRARIWRYTSSLYYYYAV